MKISLALVLASFSVLTVAKPGFVLERKHLGHHHHHHDDECACQNPAASDSTPQPVTTPASNPIVHPNQGTTTHSVTHSNSVPYTSSATRPAATGTSSPGWVQNPSGKASFTAYEDCRFPSCGQIVYGYSTAVNELAFGANSAAGGACGRCFKITPTSDPCSPSFTGPFGNTIVVKVNDLCPNIKQGVPCTNSNQTNLWCAQSVSRPLNSFDMPMHFDLCGSGAAAAFFRPGQHRALLGTYEEVSCSEWSGLPDGLKQWNGTCMAGETAAPWPTPGGCPNTGSPPL